MNASKINIRTVKDSELEKLKALLFQCYLDVQEVCNKNGLSIMLGGGSCLGAVRHKGFIPWDDDIDALMPRQDFEKLKEIFDSELGEKYSLSAPNFSEKTAYRFPTVQIKGMKFFRNEEGDDAEGHIVKIDIFILENMPENCLVRAMRGICCHALMFLSGKIGAAKDQTVWMNLIDSVCKYERESSLFGIPTGRKHYFGEIFPQAVFLPMGKGLFWGHEVNLPADCDVYLKNLYGDYMTLPPEEKREKHNIRKIDFGEY